MKKCLIIAAATSMLAAPISQLHAHEAGDILFRAGAALVAPNDSSSSVRVGGDAIGGKATVDNDTQLGLTLGYMLTDNIAVELLAATPFSHQIDLEGLGDLDGRFASVKHLPPTLSLQYFPRENGARWQPYIGAGINYTTFFNERLSSDRKAQGFSSLSLSDSWGATFQIGSDWMISDRLMLNASIWHMDIDTTARARLSGDRVKVDVDIDPWVYMIGLGYRF